MNWDDLRIFLAVARSPKLAVAARLVDLDPTTLSRRLGRLERDLGTTLFEPGPAGQVLSARGLQLLRHAETIEHSTLAARGEVAGERSLLSGNVRVSVAEGFGTSVVARHLGGFHRTNPDIVVDLIASSGFLNPSKREADIAVMLTRPKSGPLIARRLTNYGLRLYASRAYIDAAPPLRCVEDLRGHTLIGYVPDILYSPALDYLAEVRPGTEPDLRSSSINAQYALAVAGAGLAILPCFIGDLDDALVRVFPDEVKLTRSFWLVVHRDVRQLARVAAFIDWLVDVVEDNQHLLLGNAAAVPPGTAAN